MEPLIQDLEPGEHDTYYTIHTTFSEQILERGNMDGSRGIA